MANTQSAKKQRIQEIQEISSGGTSKQVTKSNDKEPIMPFKSKGKKAIIHNPLYSNDDTPTITPSKSKGKKAITHNLLYSNNNKPFVPALSRKSQKAVMHGVFDSDDKASPITSSKSKGKKSIVCRALKTKTDHELSAADPLGLDIARRAAPKTAPSIAPILPDRAPQVEWAMGLSPSATPATNPKPSTILYRIQWKPDAEALLKKA